MPDLKPIPHQIDRLIRSWSREERDIHILEEPHWTTDLERHVGFKVNWYGKPGFAKLAVAYEKDLDEPDRLGGIQREVWWSRTIQRLPSAKPDFPFRSPKVLSTNVEAQPFTADVAWVVLERIQGKPIVDWEPEKTDREMTPEEEQAFRRLSRALVTSFRALEQVNLHTLQELNLVPLPPPPHGAPRRLVKKGTQLSLPNIVLGEGSFEIKNFWEDAEGNLVKVDNEFAWLFPKYENLTYLVHRLYCNQMRPDLAAWILEDYVGSMADERELRSFWEQFRKFLLPRVVGGFVLDMSPRRKKKFWPWHRKQRLRYQLLWTLALKRFNRLVG